MKVFRGIFISCVFTAAGFSQTSETVNPVLEAGTPRVSVRAGDTGVDVRWSGGGHLESWSSDGWEVVASESPYSESKGEAGLFRVRDPWRGRRRVSVKVPSTYEPGTALPLVLLLHGFTSSGTNDNSRFQLAPLAESRGFLYAFPNGAQDHLGRRFWNASDACCNEADLEVDDSGYLRGLIETIQLRFSVDPRMIYVIGHSNGGFMALRMASDHSDLIAGVVSVAGAMDADVSRSRPVHPIHVLQVHGSSDGVISMKGGRFFDRYTSAQQTVMFWGEHNGHDRVETEEEKTYDLDLAVRGIDTTVARLVGGGANAASVELWTIDRGAHVPIIYDARKRETSEFPSRVIDWLFAHPKPVGERRP